METRLEFQKRLGMLRRRHRAMGNGYSMKLRGDGLIVAKPRRARRGFPIGSLCAIVVGFFLFKAFMFATLGEITYNERVAKLGNGTTIEQAGAWTMQSDPFTEFLAGFIEPLT